MKHYWLGVPGEPVSLALLLNICVDECIDKRRDISNFTTFGFLQLATDSLASDMLNDAGVTSDDVIKLWSCVSIYWNEPEGCYKIQLLRSSFDEEPIVLASADVETNGRVRNYGKPGEWLIEKAIELKMPGFKNLKEEDKRVLFGNLDNTFNL